jgi:hypothetical protein
MARGVPADVAADRGGDQGDGRPLGRLLSLEEAAARLVLTRDGCYRLLKRSGLPYALVGSRMGPRRRLHRRIAVPEATFRGLLERRLASAQLRGTWTSADFAALGLEPDGGSQPPVPRNNDAPA